MKKIYLSLVCLILILFVIGCTGKENKKSSDQETETPNNSPTETTTQNELSAIELMMAGMYSLHFTMDLKYPDFEYQLDCIMAQAGDKSVFLSEGDVPMNGYLKSRIITKKGFTYFVNDVMKTYSSGDDSEDVAAEDDEATSDFSSMELVSKGQEILDGIQYNYEEYRVEDTNMRFYFDSKNQLYAIRGIAVTVDSTLNDSMYGDLLMRVKEISPVPPDGIFDISADYTNVD